MYMHTSDAVAASGHVVEPAKVHRGGGPGREGGEEGGDEGAKEKERTRKRGRER